ncbi:hypothetical protein GN956_G85 [Arapaima gigas]
MVFNTMFARRSGLGLGLGVGGGGGGEMAKCGNVAPACVGKNGEISDGAPLTGVCRVYKGAQTCWLLSLQLSSEAPSSRTSSHSDEFSSVWRSQDKWWTSR